jgi:hypothetical protein
MTIGVLLVVIVIFGRNGLQCCLLIALKVAAFINIQSAQCLTTEQNIKIDYYLLPPFKFAQGVSCLTFILAKG